ncbi:AraC family transcriptional regulator [Amphritea balenae]|uniref:AraC family transcriptional regulator n=1 Tax=Amphritea balenae TaxID=452629 RepID=A0A3P1SWT2_9GAMM|nr:helix-turn-helix transcriptional regulator [Amphritea balenae]RRD01584.1 AraC family transcriptional regulator [Amphritea balenae]GGK55754.1 transcriptional regulator [Amphritea balenae]
MTTKPVSIRKRYRSKLGYRIDPSLPILGLHNLILSELELDFHHHPRGQLAYASSGVIKVFTDAGSWVVPPSQAVWIPAGIYHSVSPEISSEIRHLFIDPAYLHRFPTECSVVEVSPLLRELILKVADFGEDYADNSPASRICSVILDELQALKPSLLHLPGAADRRLLRIMQGMIERPETKTSLSYWSQLVGASERTLSRLFIKETGMTFQQWRKQLLLHEAINRLGKGESVINVALDLGYHSPSAFVSMFKKTLGKPPKQYFRDLN